MVRDRYGLTRGIKRFVHLVLQMDRPVPERTDKESTAQVERDYRWNFAANLGDGFAY